ncbi:MAG TPA: hypothetical protein VGY50_08975 [Streptosporangiaceae bacterium]|nr:hypothetical protein [Streptosporangiaceae bacterium]
MSKGSRNRQEQAREKIAQARALEAKRKRQQRWLAGAGAAVIVIAAAIGITLAVTSGGSTASGGSAGSGSTPKLNLAALSTLGSLKAAPATGPAGPEGVPIPAAAPLTGTATKATGQTVDGISCDTSEQVLFHIHAHLTLFVNGSPRQVPAGIGIPDAQAQSTPQGAFISNGKCFYWLHTHAADGIIHTESPVHRTYTLGNFFDEWGQPLGPDQAGPVKGHVTAIYNGKAYLGNPRDVPLTKHAQIQLEVGTPLVAPESITWPSGL